MGSSEPSFTQFQPVLKPSSPSEAALPPKVESSIVPAIVPAKSNVPSISTLGDPLPLPDSSLPTVGPSVDLSTSQQPAVVKAGEDYYYYYYYYDEDDPEASNPASAST